MLHAQQQVHTAWQDVLVQQGILPQARVRVPGCQALQQLHTVLTRKAAAAAATVGAAAGGLRVAAGSLAGCCKGSTAAAAVAAAVCLCADMYVFCCSYAHNVAANNKWLAFVSTTVETSAPEAELAPGLALLGPIDEKFVEVVDVHEPLADGSRWVNRGGGVREAGEHSKVGAAYVASVCSGSILWWYHTGNAASLCTV